MKLNTFAVLALALTSTAALAQTNPEPPVEPQAAPIENGRHIQPTPVAPPASGTDADATRLLKSHVDDGPVVPPHDIYGNPLGGNPTLKPSEGGPAAPSH